MCNNQDARPFIELKKDAEEFQKKFDEDINECMSFLDRKITALICDPDSLRHSTSVEQNALAEFSKAKYDIFISVKSMINKKEREWLNYMSEMKKLFIENVEIFLDGTKLDVKLPSSEFQPSLGLRKSPGIQKSDSTSATRSIYPLLSTLTTNIPVLCSPLRRSEFSNAKSEEINDVESNPQFNRRGRLAVSIPKLSESQIGGYAEFSRRGRLSTSSIKLGSQSANTIDSSDSSDIEAETDLNVSQSGSRRRSSSNKERNPDLNTSQPGSKQISNSSKEKDLVADVPQVPGRRNKKVPIYSEIMNGISQKHSTEDNEVDIPNHNQELLVTDDKKSFRERQKSQKSAVHSSRTTSDENDIQKVKADPEPLKGRRGRATARNKIADSSVVQSTSTSSDEKEVQEAKVDPVPLKGPRGRSTSKNKVAEYSVSKMTRRGQKGAKTIIENTKYDSDDLESQHVPGSLQSEKVNEKSSKKSPKPASQKKKVTIKGRKRKSRITDEDFPVMKIKKLSSGNKKNKPYPKALPLSKFKKKNSRTTITKKLPLLMLRREDVITCSQPETPTESKSSSAVEISIGSNLDDQNSTISPTIPNQYWIVLDTNVLITNLLFIKDLDKASFNDCGPPHIYIPWVVICELDNLKNPKNKKKKVNKDTKCIPDILKKLKTYKSANKAIRFLYKQFNENNPRFHGQSVFQYETWAKSYSKCNDDKILECCIGLRDKKPAVKIILLTNDKNLCLKAMLCQVIVYNYELMMSKVRPVPKCTYAMENIKKKKKEKKKSATNNSMNTGKDDVNKCKSATENSNDADKDVLLTIVDDVNKHKKFEHMTAMHFLLKDILVYFLSEEMYKTYGEVWRHFPINIHSMEDVLESISKWTHVFQKFLSEEIKAHIQLILEKFKGGFCEDDECLKIMEAMAWLCIAVKRYRPHLDVPHEDIENIFKQFKKLHRDSSDL